MLLEIVRGHLARARPRLRTVRRRARPLRRVNREEALNSEADAGRRKDCVRLHMRRETLRKMATCFMVCSSATKSRSDAVAQTAARWDGRSVQPAAGGLALPPGQLAMLTKLLPEPLRHNFERILRPEFRSIHLQERTEREVQ